MKKSPFFGSATAMVTPFMQTGVDYEAFARHIDFQIENGTDALVVCGTTGEPSTMTAQEKERVIAMAVEHTAGRVPVIVGAGGNDTRKAIEESQKAQKQGADALLLVTPYYNKTTQPGLVAHFTAIADAVDLPIILYNVPGRTGLNMLPSTVEKLAAHENIVAVKEASGNMDQITAIARIENIALYSGDDSLVLPTLALGGQGVISVISNIVPQMMHDLTALWQAGRIDKARELQLKLYPLCKASMCEVNPIPIKTAMNRMGMQAGVLRLPLVDMQPETLAQLEAAMRGLDLIR